MDSAIPEGFDSFQPVAIDDSRRVHTTLSTCGPETCSFFVAIYHRGEITVLHEGFADTANNRGTVGGSVVLDPDQFTTQAALFTRRAAKLIRPLNNEFASGVRLLSDSRIAFVDSFDSESNRTQYPDQTRPGQSARLRARSRRSIRHQ